MLCIVVVVVVVVVVGGGGGGCGGGGVVFYGHKDCATLLVQFVFQSTLCILDNLEGERF